MSLLGISGGAGRQYEKSSYDRNTNRSLVSLCQLEKCIQRIKQSKRVQAEVQSKPIGKLVRIHVRPEELEFWLKVKINKHVHLLTQPWWESIIFPLSCVQQPFWCILFRNTGLGYFFRWARLLQMLDLQHKLRSWSGLLLFYLCNHINMNKHSFEGQMISSISGLVCNWTFSQDSLFLGNEIQNVGWLPSKKPLTFRTEETNWHLNRIFFSIS